jgi:ferredoxin
MTLMPKPAKSSRTMLVCSCEKTMPLDLEAMGKAFKGVRLVSANHLCGPEAGLFREAAARGEVTVACTAQRALFEDVAEDDNLPAALTFANVRETAGWSTEASNAGPKMAALLAMATAPSAAPSAVTFKSDGVTLIYGPAATALEIAAALKDRLDITVLVSDAGDVTPPAANEFPIRRGRITGVKGYLGAFDIKIDNYASPAPSSRRALTFGAAKNGVTSKADILIDASGGNALIAGGGQRAGYLRADPANALAVQKLITKAADLEGTFDKPRYINFEADLCAHSRSKKVGCTRCLDLCPVGAIAPNGNAVVIDPHVCEGCGQCAAVCPTGAAQYALPAVDALMAQIRSGAQAYHDAGGIGADLVLHDRLHGTALIDAAARFGDGLPAQAIPLEVNEVTQVGLEILLAAVAYGYRGVRVVTRDKPRHDIAGLKHTVETATAILTGLGFAADSVSLVQTDDPDAFVAALRHTTGAPSVRARSGFAALGSKRDLLKLALRELHRVAPSPQARVTLPRGAALGGLDIASAGCTLCLSCVSACPTSALGDAADRPLLSFDESLCVQCGLCAATCPESVIKLAPRIDFEAFETGRTTVKEEEPFHCITCGKAFGVKSTIERITAKLDGKHWMYTGEHRARIDLIKKCDTCRVEAMTNAGFDPYAATPRPRAKTTDDYVKEREVAERETAMKAKIDKGEA